MIGRARKTTAARKFCVCKKNRIIVQVSNVPILVSLNIVIVRMFAKGMEGLTDDKRIKGNEANIDTLKAKEVEIDAKSVSINTFSATNVSIEAEKFIGPPGPQGPPGLAGLSGFQVIMEATDDANTIIHQIEVRCPEGKIALSGGAQVDAPQEGPTLEMMFPILDSQGLPRSWFFSARRSLGKFPWHLNAWIICVDEPK
jgi:hypothetical protein